MVSEALIVNHGKCIRQFVLNARRNAQFLSSLQKESLFTAKTAIESIKDFNIMLDIVDELKRFLFFYN